MASEKRKDLTSEQLLAAVTIFSTWKSFERGMGSKNPVSEKVYNIIKEAYQKLGK